jgi:hypothetical protein
VVGVLVTGVVVAGAATEVDAVVLVELRFAVAPLRRVDVGVEQPSAESARPTNATSRQTENHFFTSGRRKFRPRHSASRSLKAETQLASWTTSASPTLA